jgi:DNA-binding MarR family transcriptional regulator
MVERRRGELDERVVHIHLTDRGRALRSKARKIPAALACRAGYDVASERSLHELVRLRDELTQLARRCEEAVSHTVSSH